jgi:hypothetical protein
MFILRNTLYKHTKIDNNCNLQWPECLPHIYVEGDNIRGWGLWEVFRPSGWSHHEGDSCPYKRGSRQIPSFLGHMSL